MDSDFDALSTCIVAARFERKGRLVCSREGQRFFAHETHEKHEIIEEKVAAGSFFRLFSVFRGQVLKCLLPSRNTH